MSNEELRELQYNAALRYIQGVRDHMLSVDWKSVRYNAQRLKKEAGK